MKKRNLFYSIVVFVLITATILTASAAVGKQITVHYNDVKLVVDNKPVTPKDAGGNVVEPFIYNGTTYLPIRAVGEALGKNVSWDGATKTVYVGNRNDVTNYLTEVLEPYNNYWFDIYKVNNTNKLSITGKDYACGYYCDGSGPARLMYNLNGEYTSLNFDLGPTRNKNVETHIYLDGQLYNTYSVAYDDLAQNITIPLTGVLQLRIESYGYAGIGDPIIK